MFKLPTEVAWIDKSAVQLGRQSFEPFDLRGTEPVNCKRSLIMPERLVEVDPSAALLPVRSARNG